ncbi:MULTISPECIES: ribosome small subunit-dependent GTPase A [Actinomycetes]|uniref:ribosome small subunit-dependent GTPase A n=1 Tax=Actinomycetes TaxID=1760 RepID=UPI00068CAF05|nr:MULTISPECIES: ribosome small subunit-dependent GTPase A [Actinomycetes]
MSDDTSTADSMDSAAVLTELGWDEHFATAFAARSGSGSIAGRVARVDRGRCDVLTETGLIRVTVRPGTVDDTLVGTGDWIVADIGRSGEFELAGVLPRRSAIVRATTDRTSRQQLLAANVDVVLIAVSLDSPFKIGRFERLAAIAWDSGARPVVVLTKSDLRRNPEAAAAEVATVAPGVDIVVTSAASGHGLGQLKENVSGTAALLGSSGAGKSSLANALLGRDHLATEAVREVDGKGRHTTVHRQLVPLPGGGVLIDTPGLRGIGLQDVSDGIDRVFADIDDLAAQCRFSDCGHRTEPGCAVLGAVADGTLDAERLERFRALLRESEWRSTRADARRDNARREREKAIARHQKAMYRFRDRQR